MNDLPTLPQPVLVTGGAGFIGRHLVDRLLSLGNQVLVFDVPGTRLPEAWRGVVPLIAGDIASHDDVGRALAGVGTVFHAAAVVSDWAPAAEYERVTLDGSRHLFEEAVKRGTRVLLLSSFAVYGDLVGKAELAEELPLGRPLGIYGRYKQKQEELAWRFHAEQGMQLRIVRPSKVFGPGSGPWLHEVSRNLLAGKPVLINGGDFNPGLVYVDNLVDILILAASLPQAEGRVYNGYDGTKVTWRGYCTDLARIIGAPPPRALPGWLARSIATGLPPLWRALRIKTRPLLTPDSLRNLMTDYKISLRRTCHELGFEPRVSYVQAMQCIEAYWRALPQAIAGRQGIGTGSK
jgi:2-alkyl-3-oxoalkanoate reductase